MPERHEPERDPEAINDRWLDAINSIDFAAAEALLSDDFVSQYPQSGETIRGPRNMRAILENYPGSLSEGNMERATAKVIGGHQRAMTPSFAAGKITKSTVYFAPAFEPPTWRAQWVEPRGPVPPA
jgi:hypothetical protein